MNLLRHMILAAALVGAVVLVADAQEKGCTYDGKTYPHGEQVWGVNGVEKCWICDNGTWIQGQAAVAKRYCKGQY